MLKNSKVVLFVTLKSWSGRELLDPTTYVCQMHKKCSKNVHRQRAVMLQINFCSSYSNNRRRQRKHETCDGLTKGCAKFPKIYKSPQNSWRRNGDMKQVPY